MTFASAADEEKPVRKSQAITAAGLPLMTRRQLVPFLNANGIPITWTTLNKLCAPKVGQGPPVAGFWGRTPLYKPGPSLEWASSRLRERRFDIVNGAA
jgi:hypothetical protein